MEIGAARHYVGSSKFRWAPMVTLSLLGIAVLCYIAVAPIEYAAPQMNNFSWAAPRGQAMRSEAATESVDSQAGTGVAVAAVPTESVAPRNFDYFPDHFVNQATKTEDPIATF
jgi:hypothetical protein